MIATLEIYHNSLRVYNIKQLKALQKQENNGETICNLDLPVLENIKIRSQRKSKKGS